MKVFRDGKFKSVFWGVLALSLTLFLGYCGGGGGGGAPAESFKLSGTVASGAAALKTFVTFRDGDGNTYTTITDDSGKYTGVDLLAEGLSAPVLIRAQNPSGGVIYSYASQTGTANVHPLTDPIIRAWYRVKYQQDDPARSLNDDFFDETADITLPTQAEIDFIKDVITDLMRDLLEAVAAADRDGDGNPDGLMDAEGNTVTVEDFDLMETSFNADSTGFDSVLDDTTVDTSEGTGNLNIVVELGSNLETDVETTGGSTTITLDLDQVDETDTAAPGQPSAPTAAQVSDTQILVTWTAPDDPANPGQPDPDVAYYKVYDNGNEIGIVTATVFIVPGLESGAIYQFTVAACDGAANCSVKSDPSNSITMGAFTDTAAPDGTSASLAAGKLGYDEIELTWSGFSDDVGILGYNVFSCDADPCTTQTPIAKLSGTQFIHFGLAADTTYYYVVTAFDAAGNESGNSNVASQMTGTAPSGVDVTAPAEPTSFNATAVAYNRIDLSWTAPTEDSDGGPLTGLAGYSIYRDGDLLVALDDGTATSYSDTTVSALTTNNYWIKAFDSSGNTSGITTASARTPKSPDITNPEAPVLANILTSWDAPKSITVSWSASTDPAGTANEEVSGVAGYNIYRNGTYIDKTAGTTYTDTILGSAPANTYEVTAYDVAGNESVKSNPLMGSNPLEGVNVPDLIASARAKLENQDVAGAKADFQLAYNADPTSKDANFGVAITEAVMLIEEPDVVTLFQNWSTYAPTVEEFFYGLDEFEVWGGNSPYCGEDPESVNYTKLTSTSPASPFLYAGGGPYNYFMVRTPYFSEIELDAVEVGGEFIAQANCANTDWNINTANDGITATVSSDFDRGYWLGHTASPSFSVNIYTVGTAIAAKVAAKKALAKAVAGSSGSDAGPTDEGSAIVDEFKGLMNKLPKNRTSLLTRTKIAAKVVSTAPTVTEMQAAIDNTILPTISDMVAKLRVVQSSGYTFTVTPAMTGGAEIASTVLDDGEFYALDAMLSGLKAMLNILTAYNLDFDYNAADPDPLSVLYGTSGTDTTFFTLKTVPANAVDGAAKMNVALAALQDVVDQAELGYDFVFSEFGYSQTIFNDGSQSCQILQPTLGVDGNGHPTDNGISLHNDIDPSATCWDEGPYGFTPEDDTDSRNGLDAAQLVLAGQVTVTETVTIGCSVDCDGAPNTEKTTLTGSGQTVLVDESGTWDRVDSFSIDANISKFFTNPLTRDNLPTLGYDLTRNAALSDIYGDCVNAYVGPGGDGTQGNDDDDLIKCDIYPTSDLPASTLTLNGILPNGFGDKQLVGALAMTGAVLLQDQSTWGSRNGATFDGTNLWIAKYTGTGYDFFKINPSTGAKVSSFTVTGDIEISDITYLNGEFWAAGGYDKSTSLKEGLFKITYSGSTGTVSTKIPFIPSTASWQDTHHIHSWDLGVATDGTSLYVSANMYFPYDGVTHNGPHDDVIIEVNPSAVSFSDTDVTISGDLGSGELAFQNGYLWSGEGDRINITNGDLAVYVGGAMAASSTAIYNIEDNRIITFAAP